VCYYILNALLRPPEQCWGLCWILCSTAPAAGAATEQPEQYLVIPMLDQSPTPTIPLPYPKKYVTFTLLMMFHPVSCIIRAKGLGFSIRVMIIVMGQLA